MATNGKLKGRFVVALPEVDMGISDYTIINKKGATLATCPAGAIRNYLFGVCKESAGLIMYQIRENYGGYDDHAMRIPEDYEYDDGKPMNLRDSVTAEEIEISQFLSGIYKRDGRNSREYLKDARELLEDFKKNKKRKVA